MEIDDDQPVGEKNGRHQKLLSMRKEKSRDAARNRRSKENLQYVELAKLLPLPETITSQLDKASVIRLTISFLKYRELTGRELSSRRQNMLSPVQIGRKLVNPNVFEKDLGLHLLQAMDGFIFCVSQEGKFLYISETVSSHLGLSQLDLIGSSVFNIIHPDDHQQFSELLCSTDTVGNECINLDDYDAMTFSEMSRKQRQGYISIFTRMKCALVKRGGCLVKSSGYKVIHISGQMLPFKDVDHNGERSVALVATGQPLPPPTICELKLDTKVFVSRVGMDLRISFCEGRIRKYMNFTARDIVGISAYEFYHLNDMTIIHDAHSQCLNGGKCVSGVYRWMNKTGGWVRMQTVGTVIRRNTPDGEEQQILCVNYICSDVENGDEVMHTIQQHFKQLSITNSIPETERDNMDDFGTDVPGQLTSDDVKASLAVSAQTAPLDDTGSAGIAFSKESYFLALQYKQQSEAAAKAETIPLQPLDKLLGPQGLSIPSINDRIPSWQESQAMDDANALATHLLLAEFEAENTPIRYPFDDAGANSPDSSYCDMSPAIPTFSGNIKTDQSEDIYMMKATNMSYESYGANQDTFDDIPSHQNLNANAHRVTCDIPTVPYTSDHQHSMASPSDYMQYKPMPQQLQKASVFNLHSKVHHRNNSPKFTAPLSGYDQNQNPSSPPYTQFSPPTNFSIDPQSFISHIPSSSQYSMDISSPVNTSCVNMSPHRVLMTDVRIKQEPMGYPNDHVYMNDSDNIMNIKVDPFEMISESNHSAIPEMNDRMNLMNSYNSRYQQPFNPSLTHDQNFENDMNLLYNQRHYRGMFQC